MCQGIGLDPQTHRAEGPGLFCIKGVNYIVNKSIKANGLTELSVRVLGCTYDGGMMVTCTVQRVAFELVQGHQIGIVCHRHHGLEGFRCRGIQANVIDGENPGGAGIVDANGQAGDMTEIC